MPSTEARRQQDFPLIVALLQAANGIQAQDLAYYQIMNSSSYSAMVQQSFAFLHRFSRSKPVAYGSPLPATELTQSVSHLQDKQVLTANRSTIRMTQQWEIPQSALLTALGTYSELMMVSVRCMNSLPNKAVYLGFDKSEHHSKLICCCRL